MGVGVTTLSYSSGEDAVGREINSVLIRLEILSQDLLNSFSQPSIGLHLFHELLCQICTHTVGIPSLYVAWVCLPT